MPIITGTKPSAWIGSSSRPTQDFSFLRGGGVSGGGSPDAFYESRPMGRRPKTEAGEQIDLAKEPTAIDILNSNVELGVGTWTAPVLDVDAVLPSMIDSGQLSINTVKAEYINANSLSAISANLGTITSGSITGATIQTASSGTRFVMDSTSFRAINSSGDNIFEVLLTGVDVGDVIMGDDASGQYAKWDESAGQFLVAGQQLNTEVLQIGGVTVTATAAELNTKVLHNRLVGSNVTTTRPDWVCGNNDNIYGLEASSDVILKWSISPNGSVFPVNDGTKQEWIDITATYDAEFVVTSPQGSPTYIYTWAQQVIDSNWYLVRITVADGTLTEMTISGTAPDNDGLNKLAFDSNGDLFINDAGTTTVRKYTISGTTATYDSAITLSTATSASTDDGFFIGESDDFIYYTGTANVLKRDNSSGTNQDTRFITETSSKILGIFYSAPYWYAAWMVLQGSASDLTVEIQPFTWT